MEYVPIGKNIFAGLMNDPTTVWNLLYVDPGNPRDETTPSDRIEMLFRKD